MAKAANGIAIAATIEPPIHSPHVSDPETKCPPKAPRCTSVSSMTKARVAVAKTNQKRLLTRALLRFRAAAGPRFSWRIAGTALSNDH